MPRTRFTIEIYALIYISDFYIVKHSYRPLLLSIKL